MKLIIPDDISESSARIRQVGLILISAFVILFIVSIIHLAFSGLRLKKDLVGSASNGFEKILNGAFALKDARFDVASELFTQAKKQFENIKTQTWFAAPKFVTVSFGDPLFDAANSLTSAGKYLATAGVEFTGAARDLSMLPQSFFRENYVSDGVVKASLTEKLKKQLPAITASANALRKANEEVQKIPATFIPRELHDRFNFAKESLDAVSGMIKTWEEDIPAILNLLGDAQPHTFLVLLQNNAELRPSGGFIGNYLLLETNDGYITKNEVFDIYNADHKLDLSLAPPPELAGINKRWYMRDSNYSGHFPLSASKAAWFLEKERGPGVDTVIAIDMSTVEELLRLTGSIKIPELSQPITGNNFSTIFSYVIESKLSGRDNPKAMLHSFIPIFKKRLMEAADPFVMSQLFGAAIQSKHVLAYSKDETVQSFFVRHDLSGTMKDLEPKEDYLNIVHTSVGGNKSDKYLYEEITHDTYLQKDNTVKDEVTIKHTHIWTEDTEKNVRALINSFGFKDIPEQILNILGKAPNMQRLRVYVPSGSVLESSSDPNATTNYDSETKKTYFSVTLNTPVGQVKNVRLKYRLPFKLDLGIVDKYSLTVQKQAGQDNITITKNVLPDSGIKNYKYFPEGGSFDSDGVWTMTTKVDNDLSFWGIWGK